MIGVNGAKPLRIRFDKINWLMRVNKGTMYLVFFGYENMMSFTVGLDTLISQKRCIIHVISHSYGRIKVGSYDSLFLEKNIDSV